MLNKAIDFTDKFLNFVVITFCVLLILIGGYAFYDSYRIYDDTKLDDEIITLKPKSDGEFDLAKLQELNSDIEGWIQVFETPIDYPVLHSRDNLDYLNQDYAGEHSTGGSVFSDYRNSFGFSDDYTIVYGHNMVTGQMFSDIKNFADSEYFDQHLFGALYTQSGIYKLEILYVAQVNAYHDNIYNLITYANDRNEELVKLVRQKAINANPKNDVSKLLLLSTCDSYGSNDRMVLLANLSDSNGEEMQKIANDTRIAVANSDKQTGGEKLVSAKNIKPLLIIIILIIIAVVLACKIYQQYRKDRKNS